MHQRAESESAGRAARCQRAHPWVCALTNRTEQTVGFRPNWQFGCGPLGALTNVKDGLEMAFRGVTPCPEQAGRGAGRFRRKPKESRQRGR